jgi:hypothetical protein
MKLCVFIAALTAVLYGQAPQAQAPPPIDADTVVAKIDGKNVTAGQVREIFANTPGFPNAFRQNPSGALGGYFVTQYLAAEAEKKKLAENSPWKEQLEALRAGLLAQAMVNMERDGYGVSQEMMQEYYDKNKSRYESSKIKAIFIGFQAAFTPADVAEAAKSIFKPGSKRSEADAKKVADDLVKKLRAGGDFEKSVADYSEDAESKAAAGDFGVVKPNSALPETIKKAVLSLKVGEVSDPVREATGFYILKVVEKLLQPIDEVRDSILGDIRQTHLGNYLNPIYQRFTPSIERQDFFQLSGPPAAPPPAK